MAVPIHPLVRSFLRDTRWAPETRVTAVDKLNAWCRWLDARGLELTTVGRPDAEEYLGALVERGLAPASVQVHWRMMRGLHRWLVAEGEAERDPMARIRGPVVAETPVRVLEPDEYRRLVATCDRRRTYGRRDEAILSLMWWSGVRRAEVVHADLDALDLDAGLLTVGSRQFSTKTGRVRRVPLAADTLAALDRYLRRRGDEAGPLFLSQRGDTTATRRLDPHAVSLMVRRRAAAAGMDRPVGVHEFRRAMATRHKRRGGSDPALMAIAGWRSIRMIDRYTRMEREELAAEEFRRLIDTSATTKRRRRSS